MKEETKNNVKLHAVRFRNRKMTMSVDEIIEQLESLAYDSSTFVEEENDVFSKDIYSIDYGIKAIRDLDKLLNLLNGKRELAKLQLEKLSEDEHSKQESMCLLCEEIATYNDCIETLKNLRGKDNE